MTSLIALLGGLGPMGLACAGFAALAAYGLVGAPPARPRDSPDPPAREQTWLVRLVRGRPDAPRLGRRLLVGVIASAALSLLATRLALSPAVLGIATPLVALTCAIALGWLEPLGARRRRERLLLETPQALELLAACLAAGMPLRVASSAIVTAFDGPVAEDLGRVDALTALGTAEADAWRVLGDHPQLGAAAQDLARSVESGTRLTEGLRQHAEAAREHRRVALQVRARSVGVRSVLPLMLCFIPSFLLLGVVPTVASALAHALG
jgi:pilus assembly protein TadC